METFETEEQEEEPRTWTCGINCNTCMIGTICQYREIFRAAAF